MSSQEDPALEEGMRVAEEMEVLERLRTMGILSEDAYWRERERLAKGGKA